MNTNTIAVAALFVLLIISFLNISPAQAGFMGRKLELESNSYSSWAFDHKTGMIFWSDWDSRVQRLDTATDSLTVVANLSSINPRALCLGGDSDTIFILTAWTYDTSSNEIYKLNVKSGQLDLIVGTGSLNESTNLAFHNDMLFISDEGSQRILRVPATGGVVTVVASNVNVQNLGVDSEGNVFFVESISGPDYSSDVKLKMIPASNPSEILTLDESGGNYVLFVDKSRTPNDIYFTEPANYIAELMKLRIENGKPVIEGPLASGNVLLRKPWLQYPFFQKNYHGYARIAVTESGNVWTSTWSEPKPFLFVLESTPDAAVTFMWTVMISIIVLIAIAPCFGVCCVMISFDAVLIILDLVMNRKSSPTTGDEVTNSLVADVDLSNPSQSVPVAAVSQPKPAYSKPMAYIIISVIRNLYFVICSIFFAIFAYTFLYLGISGAWSQQDCYGSMCGLGWAFVVMILAIGGSSAIGWFGMSWSPIYFISSFVRKNPFMMDLVICALNLISYLLELAVVMVALAIWGFENVLLMIFLVPVAAFFVPAIILDVCFILILVGIRSGRINGPLIRVQQATILENSQGTL